MSSLLVLSAIAAVHAQDDDLCSCSPREYVFKLDLSATCPPNPPPYPPNEFFGPGVEDYTCAISSISDLITTSSKATNKIPGGISMVLRGRNAAGERVRNTFTITFTNECGVPTFEEGEAIRWVIFVSWSWHGY
jgi:hypothetical protein